MIMQSVYAIRNAVHVDTLQLETLNIVQYYNSNRLLPCCQPDMLNLCLKTTIRSCPADAQDAGGIRSFPADAQDAGGIRSFPADVQDAADILCSLRKKMALKTQRGGPRKKRRSDVGRKQYPRDERPCHLMCMQAALTWQPSPFA